MLAALLISTTCLLGVALAATFLTQPVPEEPAHPGQCNDATTGAWHAEASAWKKDGECLESTCTLSVGYLDSEDNLQILEEISPGVFRRFQDNSEVKPDSRNKTVLFKVRGKQQVYVYKEGEVPVKPHGFLQESIVSCSYHTKLPSNCRETKDPSLPYPACCPQLSCVGTPTGPIEAVG